MGNPASIFPRESEAAAANRFEIVARGDVIRGRAPACIENLP